MALLDQLFWLMKQAGPLRLQVSDLNDLANGLPDSGFDTFQMYHGEPERVSTHCN